MKGDYDFDLKLQLFIMTRRYKQVNKKGPLSSTHKKRQFKIKKKRHVNTSDSSTLKKYNTLVISTPKNGQFNAPVMMFN